MIRTYLIERRSFHVLMTLCLALASAPANAYAAKAASMDRVRVCPDGWRLVGIAAHRARAKAIVPVCALATTNKYELKDAIKAQPQMQLVFSGKGARAAAAQSVLTTETYAEAHGVDVRFVSYIGETEKNLERLLAHSELSVVVLIFDETDDLFIRGGPEAKETHDRYANQEVSYLLEKIEGAKGLILLASNRSDKTVLHFCAKRSCAAVARTVRAFD